jgi:large subunit ribosomal protein L5
MAVPRLKEQYEKQIVPELKKELGEDNVMALPRLDRVVLNMGLGEAVANPKILEGAVEELSAIAGQRAVVTKARKSIATYKLRTGMPIGARVTLRGRRMYDFLDRLINIALPRVRDSAACRPRRSTAGATTRWEFGTISFFRRSITRGPTSRRV